ncbi:MAG TPA: hypothetical protein VFQ82_07940, partial [Stellaceae bacterium]|nr:hypothetical protein [Stellaceae bacterium]
MQFFLMRFMMNERPLAIRVRSIEREAWLRRVFGVEITFSHQGLGFHYVPDSDLGGEHILVGR